MQNLPVPPSLAAPFAVSGNRNTLPLSSGGAYGYASLLQGFPPETSIPLSNGGVPPSREDMNALGYTASFAHYFLQMGGEFTYSEAVASAIGGYPLGAVLTYYNSDTRQVRKLRSVVPNNTHNFVTSPSAVGTYWEDVTPVVGLGRTMFEFFWNFSTDIPDGALPLDGRLLTGCDDEQSIYYKFYTEGKRLRDAGKIAVKSMSEYVTELNSYGDCNAFVFDQSLDGVTQSGCMRIPTVRHFVQAGTPGSVHSAGIPNISGAISGYTAQGSGRASGAISAINGSSWYLDTRETRYAFNSGFSFDASRNNSVFGGATTVQPASIELVPCIQYADNSGTITSGAVTMAMVTSAATEIANSAVQSAAGDCLPSSGGWTAIASGGSLTSLIDFSSSGTSITQIVTSTIPVTSSPWDIAGGSITYYNASTHISGSVVYNSATSEWVSSTSSEDSLGLYCVVNESTGLITVQFSTHEQSTEYQFGFEVSGVGAIHASGEMTSDVIQEDESILVVSGGTYTANIVASGGTSGGVITSSRVVDLMAGGSGGITSADADQIARAVVSSGGHVVNGGMTFLSWMVVSGELTVNGSAITQATSNFTGTSLGIANLSGGVKYVCASALTALSVGSAAPGCNGTIIFTVANGAVVTPPANVPYFGVTSYTVGSSYLMMINGDAAVCNEAAIVPGV